MLMLALLSCAGTSKVFAAQGTDTPTLAGKTISILGDSISTYAKVSNNASVNATLKDNKSYYKRGHRGV